VVPKLSLAAGVVYTYTKGTDSSDPWFLTTLDFRTGKTIYKALAGSGIGYNNNYAPVTLGPDGTAYVGTLGGLVALRDTSFELKLRQRCLRRHRVSLRISGAMMREATFTVRGAHVTVDTASPSSSLGATVVAHRGRRVKVRAELADGTLMEVRRKLRACR
jgi:hypothetical protein